MSVLLGVSGFVIGVGWFWGWCVFGVFGGGDVWARCSAYRSVYGERASVEVLVFVCDVFVGGMFVLFGVGCWWLCVGDDVGDVVVRCAGRAATRLGVVAGGLWVVAVIVVLLLSGVMML